MEWPKLEHLPYQYWWLFSKIMLFVISWTWIRMAQEFYLKASVLYEEFKKKELHYLNMERKMQSNIMWKKDLNLPLQEYLQRINQREKKAEETYKNILEQMNELDHHTDALSLKLEKLGILQRSVATSSSITPNWFQRLDFNMQSSYPTVATENAPIKDVVSLSAKSVSTQTENNSTCKRCDTLTNNQPSYLLVENSSSSDPPLNMNDKTEIIKASNHQSSSNSLFNKTQNISQDLNTKSMGQILLPTNDTFSQENLKVRNFEEKISDKNSENREFVQNKNTAVVSELHIDNESSADNTQFNVSKNNENPSKSQSIVSEKNDEIESSNSELHKKTYVSKSDADSMNNEFDFLESNSNRTNIPVPIKMKPEQDVKSMKSLKNHVPNTEVQQPIESQLKRAGLSSSKLNIADEESEVSGSVSGFNSPHMSVASDSDGVYERGSPLTASAAYQALLGNTTQHTRTPQKESSSESEDEIENALANPVQRNQLKSKPSGKQIQDETSHQSSSNKPVDKSIKSTSANKPRSKLSKSTRKVLGLDSSSASEVEIAVNAPKGKAKNDEDIDEFDFYD